MSNAKEKLAELRAAGKPALIAAGSFEAELAREYRTSAILEHQIASGMFEPQPGLAFGFPTLDRKIWNPARTINPGLRRGDIVTIGADTGMGKSTTANHILAGLARSCVAHGWMRARVIHVASEDVDDVPRKMTGVLSPTLYDRVDFINAEGSLQKFLNRFFARLIQMCREAREDDIPIREVLPAALIFDYLQLVDSDSANGNDMRAVRQTADVMRALAEGQLDQAASIANVTSFTERAIQHLGELPYEFESFRMLTVVLAQLRKESGAERHFNPDNPKDWESITDFAKFLDGKPLWEPRAGDRSLRGRDDVAGPKQQLNHSSLVLILHKMNPDDDTDDRYAIQVEKSRNGTRGTVVFSWATAFSGHGGVVRDTEALVAIGLHTEGACACDSVTGELCDAATFDLDAWAADLTQRDPRLSYPEDLPLGAPVRDAPIIYKVEARKESQLVAVTYT